MRLRTKRDPFYQTVSDHRIEADAPTAEVVQTILDTGIAKPGADT
jgi:shikimate kinase